MQAGSVLIGFESRGSLEVKWFNPSTLAVHLPLPDRLAYRRSRGVSPDSFALLFICMTNRCLMSFREGVIDEPSQ